MRPEINEVPHNKPECPNEYQDGMNMEQHFHDNGCSN